MTLPERTDNGHLNHTMAKDSPEQSSPGQETWRGASKCQSKHWKIKSLKFGSSSPSFHHESPSATDFPCCSCGKGNNN